MKCRIAVAGLLGPGDIEYEIGDELDHPDAWKQCVPNGDFSVIKDTATGKRKVLFEGKVNAEPADEECEAKVQEFLSRRK